MSTSRVNDEQEVRSKIWFDQVFPIGFQKFLARCAPRPATFEALCRSLHEFEIATQRNSCEPPPVWFHCVATLAQSRHVETLSSWWWGAVLAFASNAVWKTFSLKQHSPEAWSTCDLIRGVPKKCLRCVGLRPNHSLPHEKVLELCQERQVPVYEIKLPGPRVTLFRGIHGCHLPAHFVGWHAHIERCKQLAYVHI